MAADHQPALIRYFLMLQRGVARVALRCVALPFPVVERQCVGVQTVQRRLRRG